MWSRLDGPPRQVSRDVVYDRLWEEMARFGAGQMDHPRQAGEHGAGTHW
jgi:hypothetical protein